MVMKVIAEDFFTYSVLFEGVLAGSSSSGSIQIEADSDFQVQKLTVVAEIADTVSVLPNATVTIIDTGSGRQLMNQATPVAGLFGTGQLPFILPTPKIFLARSTISFTLANIDAADDFTNLWLNLIGKKLFYGDVAA